MPHGKHAPGTVLVTITMPEHLRTAIDAIAQSEEATPGRKPNRTKWIVDTLYAATQKYQTEAKTENPGKNPHLARSVPGAGTAAIYAPSPSSVAASRLNEDPPTLPRSGRKAKTLR